MAIDATLVSAVHSIQSLLNSPSDIDDNTEVSFQCAKLILRATRKSPDTVTAYIQLNILSKTYASFCQRYLLILGLLSLRGQINEHYAQHLIAAVALAGSLRKKSDSQSFRHVVAVLRKKGLADWLPLIKMHSRACQNERLRYIAMPGLTRGERFILYSGIMAASMPRRSAYDTLSLCLRVCYPLYRDELTQFYGFPVRYPAGTSARYRHQRTLVVATNASQRAIWLENDDKPFRWVNVSALTAAGRQPYNFKKWASCHQTLDRYLPLSPAINWPYPPAFQVHRPPQSLVDIIDLLADPDIEVSRLAEAVEAEPHFAGVLKQSASSDNRLNISVTDVKQAVMTYGLDRVGDILIQQTLLQRLSQRHFPLESVCRQFCQVVALIAQQLALTTNSGLTPQRAGLLATFLTAPLMTLPRLKMTRSLPLGQSHFFNINHLLGYKLSQPVSDLAIALLRGWHQSAQHQAIFHYAGKLPESVNREMQPTYCILMLALQLARFWLYPPRTHCTVSEQFQSQAGHVLNLTESQLMAIKNNILAELYCALPN